MPKLKHILFVCTGNTCRSPMAEQLLRLKAGSLVDVSSAGVAAAEGQPASREVVHLFEQRGVHMDHRSRLLTAEMLQNVDLVLTMTTAHAELIRSLFPDQRHIVYSMKEYVYDGQLPTHEDGDIADPFGADAATYEQTMLELEKLTTLLLEKI